MLNVICTNLFTVKDAVTGTVLVTASPVKLQAISKLSEGQSADTSHCIRNRNT